MPTILPVQQTRRLILEYIKDRGQATVDELAEVLHLTTVTVRHHLDILRSEELVAKPAIRHRTSPGRPQYAYRLTDKASQHFPKKYGDLASIVLGQLKASASPETVNTVFAGIAERFAAEAPRLTPGASITARLDRAVEFLNRRGYVARWDIAPDGFVVHARNCPYEDVARDHPEVCGIDHSLIANLLGCNPHCGGRMVEGADSCSFFIRESEVQAT